VRNYIATINNMFLLPPGCIYRGSKKFDFIVEDDKLPECVKEKLLEVDDKTNVIFKKGGETKKTRTELIKLGLPEGIGTKPKDKVK